MSQYSILPTNKDIIHHGRKDQRWGVRNGPPYPLNKEGLKKFRANKKAKKEAKAQKILEKETAIREKKEQKLAAEKERILKSGSASEALKYKGMWSVQELRNITDRIDLEVKLSGQASKEVQTGLDKLENISKTVGRLTTIGEQGISTYNLVAKVYNANQEKKKSEDRLPIISGKTAKAGKDILEETSKAIKQAGGKK